MSSFQQPYAQGLVPAIQRYQPIQQIQQMQPIGVSPEPNAGQQAYLMALQDQIKQSQKSEADAMAGYDRPRSQSGGNSMDDSIGGLIGAIAPIAMAFI